MGENIDRLFEEYRGICDDYFARDRYNDANGVDALAQVLTEKQREIETALRGSSPVGNMEPIDVIPENGNDRLHSPVGSELLGEIASMAESLREINARVNEGHDVYIPNLADDAADLLVRLGAENARLTAELVEERERKKELARAFAWINAQVLRRVGTVVFGVSEDGNVGVWGPDRWRERDSCNGHGDSALEAVLHASQPSPDRMQIDGKWYEFNSETCSYHEVSNTARSARPEGSL